MALGGVGGLGGGGYVMQGLWVPSHNGIVFEIPREGSLSLGRQMDCSGGQYLVGPEEVGPSVPDFGTGWRGRHDVGDILQGVSSGGALVRVGGVGHDPTHPKDSVGISTSGGPPDDGETTVEGRGC